MSDKVTLANYATVQGGYAYKSSDFMSSGHNKVLKIKNIRFGDVDYRDASFISNELAEKTKNWQVKQGDILISMTGSGFSAPASLVGRVARVKENEPTSFINQRVGRIIISNEISSDYVYYVISRKESQEYFVSNATGSANQVNINSATILSLELPNIDNKSTFKIAKILNDLDDKIHLNTQINQTLESMAQAIFKSWFVDFDPVQAKAQALSEGKSEREANLSAMAVISGKAIEDLSQTEYQELWEIADAFPSELVENAEFGEVPKGWELTTLSEICTMQNGYAFKSSDWRDNGIPVIKIGSVKPMIVDIESNGFVAEENKFSRSDFLLTAGDIVVGLTGYVGEVGRIPAGDEAMLNQRVAKFIPKKLEGYLSYYNFVYCLARQKNFKEYAELNAKGSAQANISTKELLNYPVCIGNKKIHLLFEKQVNSMLKQILTNSQENKSLSKTRDLLLPRLLSGEI